MEPAQPALPTDGLPALPALKDGNDVSKREAPLGRETRAKSIVSSPCQRWEGHQGLMDHPWHVGVPGPWGLWHISCECTNIRNLSVLKRSNGERGKLYAPMGLYSVNSSI